ncbi:MAG: hypothetical protein IT177_25775 [Acidobacteria bacterium]|nr:hypothetical protein [Acidobacteriota bacterium]
MPVPASTITRIRAYRVDLPLHEGRYAWSGGNAVDVFDSTVVAIDTADANTGWTQHEALRVAAAVRNVNVYIEQPSTSDRQAAWVRAHRPALRAGRSDRRARHVHARRRRRRRD